MKKILITGMTAQQTGSVRVKNIITFTKCLYMILRKNYAVEIRPTSIGEDLSGYDYRIVFLSPLLSIVARYRYSAFDVLTRYPENTVISFDDWQYSKSQANVLTAGRGGYFYRFIDLEDIPSKPPEVDQAKLKQDFKLRKKIQSLAENYAVGTVNFPIIFCGFNWGNNAKINLKYNRELIYRLDPSIYIVNEWEVFSTGDKQKRWVLGSLFDHDNFIKSIATTWPIDRYGFIPKRIGGVAADPTDERAQKCLSENELFTKYVDCAGVLSPPYKTSGDGWWRARWPLALAAGSMIYADRSERGNLPESILPDDPREMEKYPEYYIEKQGKELRNKFMSIDQVDEIIYHIFK